MSCENFEALLIDRAAGEALEQESLKALEAHLEGCPLCQRAAADFDETLEFCRLPAPTPGEVRGLEPLAGEALEAFRKGGKRKGFALGVGALLVAGALGAAAAVAVLGLRPAALPAPQIAAALPQPMAPASANETQEDAFPLELLAYEVPWSLSDEFTTQGEVE